MGGVRGRGGYTATQAAGISTEQAKGYDDVSGSGAKKTTGRREGAAGR